MAIPPDRVTTAMDFAGYRIVHHHGVVRGIVVRSRSVVGSLGASIQTLFGGNITVYTELCEQARQEAFELMVRHGNEVGANAIVAMRYDANEIAPGVTEVLAYGTAVVIEPAGRCGCYARARRRDLIPSAPVLPSRPGPARGRRTGGLVDTSCDTLVVLGSETRSGRTLFAKNSDRPTTECQPLEVV